MRVHPAIAALRDPSASQRRRSAAPSAGEPRDANAALKAVRKAWLSGPQGTDLARDLARYGDGEPLSACCALNAVMSDHRAAGERVTPLLQVLLGACRAHPLGEAPFRFNVSRGLANVQLIAKDGVTLSLAAYEPLPSAETPDTALFSDCDVHEVVLRGEATGLFHRFEGEGAVHTRSLALQPGARLALRAKTEARQILRVDRSLLILQLTREPKRPEPTRLVALGCGETVRIASGDKSASQAVMALSVLGALGDDSALDIMEQTALNSSEDPDVRWEAARQALSLEPACGLALLKTLSAREGDPLCDPATNLRAQLLEAQPELRALVGSEPSPCR